jgi:hypothetical protein
MHEREDSNARPKKVSVPNREINPPLLNPPHQNRMRLSAPKRYDDVRPNNLRAASKYSSVKIEVRVLMPMQ